jgi:MoaA/NifB/PqqE/SkfB family radical SAM enzyme
MAHKLWNIGWGVTSDCNMDCQFCYSQSKRNVDNDLVVGDWINFIKSNHSRIGAINYGTGENTLSADWFHLVDYIRTNYPKIRQALTTNGYVSEIINNDKHKLEIIKKAIDEIDVSLDFADEEKHNKFRGQKNAFKWAMNTLSFCQNNNKTAAIVCLLSRQTIARENLEGIFKVAKKYETIVRMNLYRPTNGINDLSNEFILEPQN